MNKDIKQQVNNNDNLVDYLQLIQEPINRMSTTSAIYKGFATTAFAGFSILDSETVIIIDGVVSTVREKPSILLFVITLLPILLFMMLDIYYYQLERKFRYLYNNVISGTHPCDFKIDIIKNKEKEKMKEAKATIMDCLKSPSIYLFYPPILLAEIILFVLRIVEVI